MAALARLILSPVASRPLLPAPLHAIRQAGVNHVTLRRVLPDTVASCLRQMAEGPVGKVQREVPAGHEVDADELVAGLPEGLVRGWLARDLRRWCRRLREVTGDRALVAALAVTDDDKCRKFHVDFIGLRLLITYAGPGTECAPEAVVVRAALEEPAACALEANAAIVTDRSAVLHAGAGDVVLLKGERWPGNEGHGAVHRSPPLRDQGLRRLVFTLTDVGAGERTCL